jgi:hypothetical protein
MKPAGMSTKTKDNSRKKYRENAEWSAGKKIGRKKQVWVPNVAFVTNPQGEVAGRWEKVA